MKANYNTEIESAPWLLAEEVAMGLEQAAIYARQRFDELRGANDE